MEIIMNQTKEVVSMKKQLADLLVAISWADLARNPHKLEGTAS